MISREYIRHTNATGPIDGFENKRMDEKVALLRDQLPDAVVRNSSVFSVLSVGLHELSEEKCKAIFPLMKALIFQMLEAEEQKRKAAIKQQETEAALQALLSDGSLS